MKTLSGFLALIALLSISGPAIAEPGHRYREPYYQRNSGPGPEGRGCYWFRQRLFCSRYCYVEVDGRRYCRERSRLAYPQAPDYEDDYRRHRSVK